MVNKKIIKRAKQFMPFSPLKGYYDLILAKQQIKSDKIELLEDYLAILNENLSQLKKGDMVKITYYENNMYITTTGMLSIKDDVYKYIKLIKKKINYDDIYNIERVESWVLLLVLKIKKACLGIKKY